jgi:hypothetical protein
MAIALLPSLLILGTTSASLYLVVVVYLLIIPFAKIYHNSKADLEVSQPFLLLLDFVHVLFLLFHSCFSSGLQHELCGSFGWLHFFFGRKDKGSRFSRPSYLIIEI